jgi:hypothetical protein
MRAAAFLVWAIIGTVLSYGLLYAFSPYGVVIIAICAIAGMGASRIGGRRWPEILGIAAGPGAFCLVVAASAQGPVPFILVGLGFIGSAMGAYALAMRTRCARG